MDSQSRHENCKWKGQKNHFHKAEQKFHGRDADTLLKFGKLKYKDWALIEASNIPCGFMFLEENNTSK